MPHARAIGIRSPNDRPSGQRTPPRNRGGGGDGTRIELLRSRRSNPTTPTPSSAMINAAGRASEPQSIRPASGTWSNVQRKYESGATASNAGIDSRKPFTKYDASMTSAARPAAAPRPTNGAAAQATDPGNRIMTAVSAAYPTAASNGISSPGSVANAWPVTQIEIVKTIIASATAVR